jgi:hypothetical protein
MGSVQDSAISNVSLAKLKSMSLEGQRATMYNLLRLITASTVAQKLIGGIYRQVGDTIYLHFSSRKGKQAPQEWDVGVWTGFNQHKIQSSSNLYFHK